MSSPHNVSDCHVATLASAKTTVLCEFKAVFQRVINDGARTGLVTEPVANATLLDCTCEEPVDRRQISIFGRDGSGTVVVSLPLQGGFETLELPDAALRIHAPPCPTDYLVTFQSQTQCENTLGCLLRFANVMRNLESRLKHTNSDGQLSGLPLVPAAEKEQVNKFGQRAIPVEKHVSPEESNPKRGGLAISGPTDTKRMTHVHFDEHSQTFAGVPKELQHEFAQIAFNLPLTRVTSAPVEGYEVDIPVVLVLLREYFLKRDGQVGSTYLLAVDPLLTLRCLVVVCPPRIPNFAFLSKLRALLCFFVLVLVLFLIGRDRYLPYCARKERMRRSKTRRLLPEPPRSRGSCVPSRFRQLGEAMVPRSSRGIVEPNRCCSYCALRGDKIAR